MKKLIIAGFAAAVAATTFAQGAGRAVYKPGQTTNPPAGRVEQSNYDRTVSVDRNDYDRTPGGEHIAMTPFALCVGGWGMPYGRNWAICGARLNLGWPGWTQQYASVYGLDVGLSGETFGEAGFRAWVCPWRYLEHARLFVDYANWHECGGNLRGILLTTWYSFADVADAIEGKPFRKDIDEKTARTLQCVAEVYRAYRH